MIARSGSTALFDLPHFGKIILPFCQKLGAFLDYRVSFGINVILSLYASFAIPENLHYPFQSGLGLVRISVVPTGMVAPMSP
jgi:hypothetical protein